jgi:TolA-binding protein
MKRSFEVLGLALCLVPGAGWAASREQQEMQRDIAQLQDQVRTMQSSFDQKVGALETLIGQAIEAGNKASANIAALGASVGEKLDSVSKGALLPLAGLTAKVDNVENNQSTLINSITSLQEQLNRQQQLLTDINNAMKVLQAPAAAPPPPNGADGTPTAGTPPPASSLWDSARLDYSTGKFDIAADDYAQFLRYYPDDPNAPEAQFLLGRIHSAQSKYDQAAIDYEAVIARYADSKYAPEASFQKAMALNSAGHPDAAENAFRALIKKYPRSDRVRDAQTQLRALDLKHK